MTPIAWKPLEEVANMVNPMMKGGFEKKLQVELNEYNGAGNRETLTKVLIKIKPLSYSNRNLSVF